MVYDAIQTAVIFRSSIWFLPGLRLCSILLSFRLFVANSCNSVVVYKCSICTDSFQRTAAIICSVWCVRGGLLQFFMGWSRTVRMDHPCYIVFAESLWKIVVILSPAMEVLSNWHPVVSFYWGLWSFRPPKPFAADWCHFVLIYGYLVYSGSLRWMLSFCH